MRLRLVLLFCLGLWAPGAQLDKGLEHFYNLEYDEALVEFRRNAAAKPDDAGAANRVAHGVLYREMFRAGALESELVSGGNPFLRRPRMQTSAEAAREFESSIERAMQLAKKTLATNPDDRQALYDLGVSHGLRANFNFLVRKAWMDSLRDATAARKLHNRATSLDPSFIDAKLIPALHDYVLGSLPFGYKVLGFLAGWRGDREAGLRILRLVAEQGRSNAYDAQILLAALYRRERRSKDAIPLLLGAVKRFPRNYLLRLELAQMHADIGEREQALALLDEVEAMKRAGSAGFDTLRLEKIFFYRGNLLFWFDNHTAALEQLERVTAAAGELDLSVGVMAWLRTGQIHDLAGRRERAVGAYKQAMLLAPSSEAAKEARLYMSSRYKRKN